MAPQKFFGYNSKTAFVALIALALILTTPLALPGFRAELISILAEDEESVMLSEEGVEESVAEGASAPETPQKPGLFRRIVSSPFKLISRAFRPKNSRARYVTVQKSKVPDNFKTLPVYRSRDGLGTEVSSEIGSAPVNIEARPAETMAMTTERAANSMYEEGVALQERGQIDAAMEKLTASVTLRPQHAEAHNLLGVCFDQKGLYGFAQSSYLKAIKVDDNNPRFLNNLGYSYYLDGENKDAIKWFKKALKHTPEDKRLHNNLGLAYGRTGDFKKALEHFTRSVGESGAHLNLGYVLAQQGRSDDAIKEYESALRIQPDSLTALSSLVRLYEKTGRLREAAYAKELHQRYTTGQSAQQGSGQK